MKSVALLFDCCAPDPFVGTCACGWISSCDGSCSSFQRHATARDLFAPLNRCSSVACGALFVWLWCERACSKCVEPAHRCKSGCMICVQACPVRGFPCWARRRWEKDCIRPVLKHGPRSLTFARVCTIQLCTRSEGARCEVGCSDRPQSSVRGLSRSAFVRTRKMVNYACAG